MTAILTRPAAGRGVLIGEVRMETVGDVRSWFRDLVLRKRINLHPDTPGLEYMSGTQFTFSRAEARNFDERMSEAFNICQREGVDVYELALEALQMTMSKEG